MRIVIDTNRYRDLRDGNGDVLSLIESATEVFVPYVVAAELKTGFGQGKRRAENERLLNSFLRSPGVHVLFPRPRTIDVFVELFMDLKRRGKPIPLNDLWIAALCVDHGLALYTRDNHFAQLPQLQRV